MGPEEPFVALGPAKSRYAFLLLSPAYLFFRQGSSDVTQTGLKFSMFLPQITNAGHISMSHHSQQGMPFFVWVAVPGCRPHALKASVTTELYYT